MDLKRLLRSLTIGVAALSLASSASAQSLKAQYRPSWISVNDNQIAIMLNLVNTGSSAVALNTVTVRYYYTVDGTASQSYWCDYTPRGCSNVTGSFGTVSPAAATADTYFQLGFSSGAGSLSAGQSTGEIQLRIAKSNWSNYNESNDYSYAGNSSSADAPNITVYVNGTLVWGTPPGGPTADFTVAASPAAVSVERGGSATTSIAISRTSFTSAVALTASGLPAGVTAAFSPASTTGDASTLTLTATATAAIGTSTVTVTGAGGGLTRTAQLSLTVTGGAQDFSLTATPATVTASAGASVTSVIAITRTSFTSAVAFTASGLPAGVTATFTPTSTTGASSTLTLAVSATAAAGTSTVTVTGTAGTLVRTAEISLTITGDTPTFVLSATPATLSVVRGASATSTIGIARTSFTSSVALTASGLPAGVTATFTPASTTGTSSNVTFAASTSAATGTSTVTITGAGGGLTRTTQINLTVSGGTSDLALTATPATVSVARGASATSAIAITRTNLTASVTLSASGLPAGVTATFSPASTTGNSSTLTLAASATATTGTATVTVTATGGGATASVPISLTVGGGDPGTWRVNAQGRITRNGTVFPVRCGSWFGLQGRYEPASDSQNPRGAPMEQYIGNTFWANGGQGTGRTIAQTFSEIKAQGMNVIRLPLVHQTLNAQDPQGRDPYLKNHSSVRIANSRLALETMMKAASTAGVYVLLDIHSCSNYVDWRKGRLDARPPWVDADRNDYDFKREECSCAATGNPPSVTKIAAYNESLWLEDLRTLAGLDQQLGTSVIIGIDIYNEPWDYSWTEWKGLIERAYAAINAVNSNILVFAQGIGTSHGNQDGTPDTKEDTPHGDLATNPNWGENLYEAGDDPPAIPKERLVFSPHTYGPSVFVQRMFMDPAQSACTGLEGDEAGDQQCNIVINSTLLRQGWEEHFGYLKDLGYAVVVGEFGGNLDWPGGQASTRDRNRYAYLTDKTTDSKWQNAFVDYMVSKGIEGCYWSINPESGDTGGWYGHAYDPITNTGGWGEWKAFDSRKTTLLKRLWGN